MEFNQPGAASGDKIELDKYLGRLLLIWPKEKKNVATEAFGEKECLVADVVVLETGEELRDVFLFPGVLIGQLKGYIGNPNPALGRLTKGLPKPGKQAAWQLDDFTPQDASMASAWINSHPRGFSSPAPVQQQTSYQPPVDYQAAAAQQALEQQRAAAAQQAQNTQTHVLPEGGYVNTGTGEITSPAAGAVNVETVRTLLNLAIPDDQIMQNTGATQEQLNAIRNLPVS